MREKVQHNPGCNAEFLAQEKKFFEGFETLTFDDEDHFVNAPLFENLPGFLFRENADRFQSPCDIIFDRSRERSGGLPFSNDGNVTDRRAATAPNPEQHQSVGNQETVIDNESEQRNEPARGLLIQKEQDGRHNHPCQTDGLGELRELIPQLEEPRRIHTEPEEQDSPYGQYQRQNPDVYANRQDCKPFYLKRCADRVGEEEAGGRQNQVDQEEVKGQYLLSLLNHSCGTRRPDPNVRGRAPHSTGLG